MYYKTCTIKPLGREWTFISLRYTNVEYCFNLHVSYSSFDVDVEQFTEMNE